VTFINTLFYEVIAEVEGFMRHLQALADKRDIGQEILKSSHATRKGKKNGKKNGHSIKEYISPMAVEVNLKGENKEEILKELVGLLVRSNSFNETTGQKIYRELLEREKLMSTGMQDGVALPHVKTDLVDNIRFAIGLKKGGIDFDSLDKNPSEIFILAVASKKSHESYLQHLEEISKFLSSEENRRDMIEASPNKRLFKILLDGL
jgi:mannitol/fructose-specific phosphotransferase system IIA component (Ntr-type)